MTTTVTIEVTQDDIDQGSPANCTLCPVARAASRVFPGKNVQVGRTYMSVHNTPLSLEGYTEVLLPPEVTRFIRTFDQQGRAAVQPFTFTVITAE